MDQMEMNHLNPMMNQDYATNNNNLQQLMLQKQMQIQQMIQLQKTHQEMIMNQLNEKIQEEKEKSKNIYITFRKNSNKGYSFQCHMDEKISIVIERYRNIASDFNDNEKFIFNAKALNPSITVAEAGFNNNSNIFVVETKGVRGG